MPGTISRRAYLRACGSLTAAVAVTGFSTSCAKSGAASVSCSAASAMSETDRQTRTTLAYMDPSAVAEHNCANCMLYIEPVTYGTCGACQLVKGQISAGAYCNAWAAKAV